jgi:hypothetical protein
MRFLHILLILGTLFLTSCGGKNVSVPGQDVSFIRPPSDWQVTLFTSTSKVPSRGFLPIKLFKASWGKNNLSTIGITGSNISGIRTKGSTRKGLLNALESEINEFKKVCGHVTHKITHETSGALRNNIDFTGLEAEIKCYLTNPDDPLKAKTVIYVLEAPEYIYTLQFKAAQEFYDKDIHVFRGLLNSITFSGR